jgi:DNA-3-methyladenine glycosylase II
LSIEALLSSRPGIKAGIAYLTARDPDFAAVLDRFGPLRFALKPGGFAGLLRIILGQQVSVLAADAIWRKLCLAVPEMTPDAVARTDDESLRAVGLSRQKIRYVKGLAGDILQGRLDLERVGGLDDEDAIAAITKGIGLGRWTAENYLLFCEGRADLFPAKDLAILIGLEGLKAFPARPTPIAAWEYAERWRPYRSAATLLIWHHYIGTVAERRVKQGTLSHSAC